jgi:hypothetical protein
VKPTKSAFDGDKFVEISDAKMPEFIASYTKWQARRAGLNGRFVYLQTLAIFAALFTGICVAFSCLVGPH